ncbi:MAG: glycosyltransferase family 4 protein [Burkholderiales bacterium]|nr:glycosyltransferase family 4 protein [Burkholderiales bacterium]
MKLALIRQRYNPFGGAERFIERALAALTEQGASVTVIAREWPGAPPGARFERCDPFYLGRLWRDRGFARAACAAAAGGASELVQSHERIACCDVYRAGDGVHAQWLEYRARMLAPLGGVWLRLSPYQRSVLAAERRLFASPRLAAVICNSRMVRDEIARRFGLPPEKLHVIYNGVDLDAFHPGLRQQHRDAVRAALGLPAGARLALFVGSGFARKGVAQLLDAWVRLADPALHLAIVGRDRDARRLERRARALERSAGARGRIHFAGPQADVKPWYGAADCFVLPTHYDPFPNAALEALACGLPVVTTRRCGAAELIREGWNGYLCEEPGDVERLAGCIARASAPAQAMRSAARESALPCGLAVMASSLLALYRKLASRVPGPANAAPH